MTLRPFQTGRTAGQRRGAAKDEAGTLSALRSGERARIVDIPDERARAQAIRFGMGSGACVRCVTALPGGPVVLRSGRQEIAVGRSLARRIRVEYEGEVSDGLA